MTALIVILSILVVLVLWQLLFRIGRRYIKFPAPSFITLFLDSNFRKSTQPPARIVADSGIKPGMKILEVGCGSGAFTIAAARAAGEGGKVYALDIQEDMLNKLRARLARPENSGVRNIEIIQRSAYELPFEDNSLDLVFMVTVLQEIPDKPRALREIKRVLKPSGILAVSEYLVDPDYPWRSTTERMVKAGGFELDGFAGSIWSYTIRFRKP